MQPEDVANERPAEKQSWRPAYWMVGAGIIGLVILLVAISLLLDRRFRPTVGTEPVATSLAVVQPTQPALVMPTSVSPGAAAAATVTIPPGVRVASGPLEREIEAGYLRYWDVLIQAYLNLDTSHLGEVMAGDELARVQKEILDLKAQGKAAKLDVEHRIAFAKVAPDNAIVYDEYLNKSVFVDPTTKQELRASEPATTEKISIYMRKVDGSWKVTGGVRND
ncbi:MAG: hypothetical protein U0822_11395 [Anaerolineae bacterium]